MVRSNLSQRERYRALREGGKGVNWEIFSKNLETELKAKPGGRRVAAVVTSIIKLDVAYIIHAMRS